RSGFLLRDRNVAVCAELPRTRNVVVVVARGREPEPRARARTPHGEIGASVDVEVGQERDVALRGVAPRLRAGRVVRVTTGRDDPEPGAGGGAPHGQIAA